MFSLVRIRKSERRKEKKMDWSKYKTLADTFRTSDEHLLQTRNDYEMNLIRRELNNCRHFMIKTTDHLEGQVCALCLDQIPAQLLITLSTLSSSSSSSNCAPNKVTISGSISSPATSPSSSSSSSSLLPSSSSPGSTRTPVIHFHSTCLKCFTCQESLLHQMILLYPSLNTHNNVQSHLQSQQHLHSHQLPQPGCPPLPQTPQPSRPTPEEPLLNPLLLVEPKFNPKTNRFYCLRHFLELFKPRCSYCDELIFEEECTEAENRVWHINHFICWECQRPLGGQQYVMKKPNEEEVKDEKPYCLLCFDLIFGQLCEECGEIINCSFGSIQYQGRHWHASDICFKCFHCSQSLLGKPFLPANDGQIYCSFNCSNQQQLKYIHNNNRSKSSHNESNHNHNKSNGHLNKSQSISDNSNSSSSSCNKSDHIKSSSLNNGSTTTTTNNTGSNSKSNSNNSNQLIVEEKRKNDEEKTIVNKVVVVNKVVEEEEKEDEMTRRNKKTMVDVMTMMMMMDKVEAGDVDVDKVEKRTKLIETGLNTGLTKDARNSAGNGGGHHHQHHHHHQEPDVVPQIKVMDTGESSNSGGSCSGSNNGVEIKDVELEEEEEELKKEIVTTKKVTFDPRILEKVSRKRHCNDDTCSMCSYSSTVSIGSTDSISSSSSSSSSSSLCSLDFGHLNGGQRLLHSSSTSTTLPSSFHPHHSSSSQLGPHPHPARHQSSSSSSSSTLRHRNGETNISGVSGHQKYIRQQQTACYLM